MSAILFAWRGWVSGTLFAVLAAARFFSKADLLPAWLLLAAAGVAYRLYAARYIAEHSNGSAMAADPLATRGPYALGRHPLYLANLAVAAGTILYAHCLPWWGGALLLIAVAGHYVLLARAEERFLLARLGETYASYLRSTPRWLGVAAIGRVGGGERAALSSAFSRQGGNLAKALVCVILIRVLAWHA